ncbi:hypothetical protein GQ53DRAFT_204069 [Thozetella sp. PMI_491]|nr:hypothetical protein GQ53DRAFT_204069 [Thozetella sp. PMI_491]
MSEVGSRGIANSERALPRSPPTPNPDILSIRAGPTLRFLPSTPPDRNTSSNTSSNNRAATMDRRNHVLAFVATITIVAAISSVAAIATAIAEGKAYGSSSINDQLWTGISLAVFVLGGLATTCVCVDRKRAIELSRTNREEWIELPRRNKALPPNPVPDHDGISNLRTTEQLSGHMDRLEAHIATLQQEGSLSRIPRLTEDGSNDAAGSGTSKRSPNCGGSSRATHIPVRSSIHSDNQPRTFRAASAPVVPTVVHSEGSAPLDDEEATVHERPYFLPHGHTVSHTRGVPSQDFFNGRIKEWDEEN